MNKKIKIINCGFGNLESISNSLNYLGFAHQLINHVSMLDDATHVILPGVGTFQTGMQNLKNEGWIERLHSFHKNNGYILGICLGMQLLFRTGTNEENNQIIDGLGFFNGHCEKFKFDHKTLPVPHIGFNKVKNNKTKIWNNIDCNSFFYFVHSYRVVDVPDECKNEYKICYTNYGDKFISFIEKKNIFGAQFHPEKSHLSGLKLIKNFCLL